VQLAAVKASKECAAACDIFVHCVMQQTPLFDERTLMMQHVLLLNLLSFDSAAYNLSENPVSYRLP
jgi:hypothetical protein